MVVKILYVFFVIICCWITYLYTLNKCIKIAKLHDETDEMIADYVGKSFEQIAIIQTDINNILEIIGAKNDKEKMRDDTQK